MKSINFSTNLWVLGVLPGRALRAAARPGQPERVSDAARLAEIAAGEAGGEGRRTVRQKGPKSAANNRKTVEKQ